MQHAAADRPGLQVPCRPHPAGHLRAAVPRRRADRLGVDGGLRRVAARDFQASPSAQDRRPRARPPPGPRDALQRGAKSAQAAHRLDGHLRGVLARKVRRSRKSSEQDGPMSKPATETRSVVVEREMPHPPERIWRALTQPHLIEEWLMKNDFKPAVGHRFNLRGEWGGVLDCEVLAIEPNKALSYTWNLKHADAAFDLQSVVTFTLTPTRTGTLLRMEQSGFRA